MDDHIEKPTSDLIFSWPNYPESMLKLLQNSKMTNPCKNAFAGPERVKYSLFLLDIVETRKVNIRPSSFVVFDLKLLFFSQQNQKKRKS